MTDDPGSEYIPVDHVAVANLLPTPFLSRATFVLRRSVWQTTCFYELSSIASNLETLCMGIGEEVWVLGIGSAGDVRLYFGAENGTCGPWDG